MKHGRAWGMLLLLALGTPFGIMAVGGAWGEWDIAGIEERAGFVPNGMQEAASGARESSFKDYTIPGLGGGLWRERLGTIVTALMGAGATALAAYAIGRVVKHGGIS